MTRKAIRAAAEGLPEITRRQALATALTVAFAAPADAAQEVPAVELPHDRVRRIAKDLAYALKDWNNEIGGPGSYWVARIYPVGLARHPVCFESVEPKPVDRVEWVQANPYAMQNAINVCSRAIEDHVAAPDAGDDEQISATCWVAYQTFQHLLALPCRSQADITAKTRAILELAPRGGYHPLEPADTVTLLRSILGEGDTSANMTVNEPVDAPASLLDAVNAARAKL